MLTINLITSVLPIETKKIYIAYSGGVDSHVLLNLCCSDDKIKSKLKVVHINHGLQPEASQWAKHCESIALNLGVGFQCVEVNAQKISQQSPEEVARDVRYEALKMVLHKNDVLLVAQHREDQMETVLLQLFRGAGVQGLSGMPLIHSFGLGVICRPLLESSKQDVVNYAMESDLHWIEDPSNKSNEFDRNFLRNQIIPSLKQRWPTLDKTISRSARHCASSHALLDELSSDLLDSMFNREDQTLCLSLFLELGNHKKSLVIRQWFNHFQLRMPSEKIIWRIINEVALAKVSANPEVKGRGYCIRRYRDKLYCLNDILVENRPREMDWGMGLEQLALDDGRILYLKETIEGISKEVWRNSFVSVQYRKGSEKIELLGRVGHHSLKKLFQEKGIPPWERNVPLIYLDGVLAVVVGLWVSSKFLDVISGDCFTIKIT